MHQKDVSKNTILLLFFFLFQSVMLLPFSFFFLFFSLEVRILRRAIRAPQFGSLSSSVSFFFPLFLGKLQEELTSQDCKVGLIQVEGRAFAPSHFFPFLSYLYAACAKSGGREGEQQQQRKRKGQHGRFVAS